MMNKRISGLSAIFFLLLLLALFHINNVSGQEYEIPNVPVNTFLIIVPRDDGGIDVNNSSDRKIDGILDIRSGGILVNDHSGNLSIGPISEVDGSITNGAIAVAPFGLLENKSGAVINNHGILITGGPAPPDFLPNVRNDGLLNNYGEILNFGLVDTIARPPDINGARPGIINHATGIINNNSEFNITSAPVCGAPCRMDNFGTINNNSLGIFNIRHEGRGVHTGDDPSALNNTGTFNNFGTLNNDGTFDNAAGGHYFQSGDSSSEIVNDYDFTNAGTTVIGEGSFTNRSLYNQQAGGTTQIDGTFSNIGGRFGDQGTGSRFGGDVFNAGTITIGTTGFYDQSYRPHDVVPGQPDAAVFTVNKRTFTNEGRVQLGTGTTFTNTQGAPSSRGLYDQRASGTTQIDGTFDNSGGRVINAGAITVGQKGVYNQIMHDGVPGATTNSGTFTNAGTVGVGVGTTFTNTLGAPSSVGLYDQRASGTTQIDGTFDNSGGRVINAGAITVGTTGEYNQRQPLVAGLPGATTNSGTFTNAGTTVIDGGTFANQGSVVNSGTFQVAALGQVSGAGSYEQIATGAQTIVNGTFGNNINLQAGALSGTGTITGAVTNTGGVVQPGSGIQPGTLTLASYTQGADARLDLKIGGLLAGSQYDVLKVAGPVSLHGGLFVNLINGFVPKLGNEFNLITGSSFDVGLRQVSLPRLLAGMDWLTSFAGGVYNLTVRQVAVSAPEPSSLLLSGVGFAWLVGWRWRKQQNRKATN